MTYYSLFEGMRWQNSTLLEYRGHLNSILDDILKNAESSPTSTADRCGCNIRIALQTARIIRAVIDYKINYPGYQIETILRCSIESALNIYSNVDNAAKEICQLKRNIFSEGLTHMLETDVYQEPDIPTWKATAPEKSAETAHKLADKLHKIHSEDILFIALAHGGVAPGMDTYLQYCDITSSKNSCFYVARMSTRKLLDSHPKLSITEIKYLAQLGADKPVVVFDEDTASGRTLKTALCFFEERIPCQNIIRACNTDLSGI